MLALEIIEIKAMMSKLLKESTFDDFNLKKLSINSFAYLEISETAEPCNWANIKPVALAFIQGKQRPSSMHFVLKKDANDVGLDGASSAYITIKFEDGRMIVTSGVAMNISSFELNIQNTGLWNEWIKNFLNTNGIEYSKLN